MKNYDNNKNRFNIKYNQKIKKKRYNPFWFYEHKSEICSITDTKTGYIAYIKSEYVLPIKLNDSLDYYYKCDNTVTDIIRVFKENDWTDDDVIKRKNAGDLSFSGYFYFIIRISDSKTINSLMYDNIKLAIKDAKETLKCHTDESE